jgi:hypothetical protein
MIFFEDNKRCEYEIETEDIYEVEVENDIRNN